MVARERVTTICPRCCNQTDRIINNRLCVSCYNRDMEVHRGRNRKGTVPRLSYRLGALSCVIVQAGCPEIATWRGVTGLIECAITSARRATGPVAFGRRPPLSTSFVRRLPRVSILPAPPGLQLSLAF